MQTIMTIAGVACSCPCKIIALAANDEAVWQKDKFFRYYFVII